MSCVSIVIPSRNEKYLSQTIRDLLTKATGEIEIIAVLDGWWQSLPEYIQDKRVKYLHYSPARGMRNAINKGLAIATGEYIFKIDAHCMVEHGYDEILSKTCGHDWVVVPRRYALDPEKWERTDNPKYPVDYMYLSDDLHGIVWKDIDNKRKDVMIDDLMSSQGSAWFMRKAYFEYLELMDESLYGSFSSEFQEIGLKCWLSGGRVVVNKNTWYAHWHKEEGRGYSLDKKEGEKASIFLDEWINGNYKWFKQIHPISWLRDQFPKYE